MFHTLIVNPIFNLLVFIYAILPGHNFGLAIILFTVLVRLLMWPLVQKQLHQAKAMKDLQPELKKLKKAANGNKQQESLMLMELYKERGINPFASIGLLVVQIPIFLGLYSGLKRIVEDPHAIVNSSYSFVQHLGWIKELSTDIHKFDSTLFGVVDLTKSALDKAGHLYWPAMIIVLASAIVQYYQAKQLAPDDGKKRSLRSILKQAGNGQQADNSEVSAAVARSTRFMLPAFIFLVTVNIASALSLYWLASGVVAFAQQARVLGQDKAELTTATDGTTRQVIEAEVLPPKPKTRTKKPTAKKARNKRRK
jgi:YidC/Oxa1 family membrane protein insertase